MQTTQLRTIMSMSPAEVQSILKDQPMPGIALTEHEMIRNFLIRKSTIDLNTGQILQLRTFQKYETLILHAAANFKKENVRSKTIVPASLVTQDNIGIETLDRPGTVGLTSYRQTGLSPGIINVIKQDGSTHYLDANKRERIVLLGFVNMLPGSGISEIQVIDDGNANLKPENPGYQFSYDVSARVYELEVPRIVDTSLQVKVRLTEGNSLWLVPIGIRLYDGALAPSSL